jgi:hypothetical protein
LRSRTPPKIEPKKRKKSFILSTEVHRRSSSRFHANSYFSFFFSYQEK